MVSTPYKLYYLFYNHNTIYNLLLFGVSFVSLTSRPYFYAFLLVDVFKRSPDLFNIVRSITRNKTQLLYTLLLSVIAIYIFSMWGYVQFQEFFYEDFFDDAEFEYEILTDCESIFSCFVSTLH